MRQHKISQCTPYYGIRQQSQVVEVLIHTPQHEAAQQEPAQVSARGRTAAEHARFPTLSPHTCIAPTAHYDDCHPCCPTLSPCPSSPFLALRHSIPPAWCCTVCHAGCGSREGRRLVSLQARMWLLSRWCPITHHVGCLGMRHPQGCSLRASKDRCTCRPRHTPKLPWLEAVKDRCTWPQPPAHKPPSRKGAKACCTYLHPRSRPPAVKDRCTWPQPPAHKLPSRKGAKACCTYLHPRPRPPAVKDRCTWPQPPAHKLPSRKGAKAYCTRPHPCLSVIGRLFPVPWCLDASEVGRPQHRQGGLVLVPCRVE